MFDTFEGGVVDAVRSRYALRLGVALLGAVALLLVLGVVVQGQAASEVREDAHANLETSAAIQSDEIDEWVEGNRRQVRTVSRLPALQSDDHDAINRELGDLIEEGHVSDEVVAIHVVSKDEEAIVASSRPEKFVGKSPAEMDEPFVPKLKAGFEGSNEVYVSEPFHIPIVEFPIVAMLSPVPEENRVVVFMINPTGEIDGLRQPIEGGHTHVVTADGRAVAAPNNTTHVGAEKERAIENAVAGESGVVERDDGTLMGYAPVASQNWVVLTHVDRSEAYAMTDTVRAGIGSMVLVALLTLGLVGATVGRSTATALRSLADDARALGEGDLRVTFDVDRQDEIGTLGRTLAETRDSLRERLDEVEEAREAAESERQRTERMHRQLEATAEEYRDVMDAAAEGDLTRRMDPDDENRVMSEIAVGFNRMLEDIESTVEQVQHFATEVAGASEDVTVSSEEVRSASERVAQSVREISDGTEGQNESLRSISEEMEELSSTTEEIAASSNEVADIAERTAEAGRGGREAAREAIEGMNDIETESEGAVEQIEQLQAEVAGIDELLEYITDVAQQTNVLALNASIEAAHSAEGSEGFAVIADQVKELASNTQGAAEDIETRLERIKEQTDATAEEVRQTADEISAQTESVREAADALEEISRYAQETNTGVQEISTTTRQQAATAQDVVTEIDTVASISDQTAVEAETVSAAAEEQTATLADVSENASELSTRADKLQSVLADFEVGRTAAAPGDGDWVRAAPMAEDD